MHKPIPTARRAINMADFENCFTSNVLNHLQSQSENFLRPESLDYWKDTAKRQTAVLNQFVFGAAISGEISTFIAGSSVPSYFYFRVADVRRIFSEYEKDAKFMEIFDRTITEIPQIDFKNLSILKKGANMKKHSANAHQVNGKRTLIPQ